MSERALATIRKITAIDPIPGADKIEVCTVDGWKVVSQKGTYQVGDLAVYCEVDSWIPATVAPFLCEHLKTPREYNGVPGERLRTIRLRGQVSQGLLLPIETLPTRTEDSGCEHCGEYTVAYEEGEDVTELLNIQKYEKPIPTQLDGVIKGNWPQWLRKTDQERIQNYKKYLESWILDGGLWEVTEKLDGSSMTVYIKDGEVGVCSRNNDLKENDDNAFWRVAKQNELIEKLRSLGRNYAFQGELVGEGVQGNRYGLNGLQFYLYDVWDIDNQEYLLPSARLKFAGELNILQVPNEGVYPLSKDVEWFLEHAENKSQLNPTVEREGLVWRSLIDDKSFKVISNAYLLKYDE